MEKIFDVEFRNELYNCLKESGMKEKQIYHIINARYKTALKEAVLCRLRNVIALIEQEKFSEVEQFIDESPAGDGYGCDNRYISFNDITDLEDIGEVIDKLGC